jgi:ADP-ribose pyrophosphatase
MTIYVARDLEKGEAEPEEDEVITVRFFPLSQAVKLATSGKILDAKTIAGILWLNESERNRKLEKAR